MSAVAATLAAPLLVYLIAKTAMAGLGPVLAITAGALPPTDPTPVMRQVLAAAQSPKFKVSQDMHEAARDALGSAPLAFEPFYVAARAEEQAGRLARATALLEEAKQRRPSHPAVRMQLVVYYTQAQRYRDSLEELDWLMQRDAQLQLALMPELIKLLPAPEGREALAELLARNPEWAVTFAETAAKRKVDPAHARALYDAVQARKKGGNLDLERQIVLEAQIGAGEYAAARSTALAALPQDARAANALLFDPDFRGTRVPRPFGWSFLDDAVGRSEPARDGNAPYLDVSFFGGSNAVLAQQILALPPGKYSLRTLGRLDGVENGGRISWQLGCLPGAAPLARLDLPRAAGSAAVAAAFTVPAGCAGQSLRLTAEAGEVSSTITAQVSRVEIRR